MDEHLELGRRKIDALDAGIANLVKERARIARELGEYKRANDLDVYDNAREKEVVKAQAEDSGDVLSYGQMQDIFESIVGACREIQQRPLPLDD